MSLRGRRSKALRLRAPGHALADTLEPVKQFASTLIPFVALFAERPPDNLLKLAWNLRAMICEVWRYRLQNRGHHFSRCLAAEGCPSRDHLIKHDPKTPDISSLIHRFAEHLFRRHITSCPKN